MIQFPFLKNISSGIKDLFLHQNKYSEGVFKKRTSLSKKRQRTKDLHEELGVAREAVLDMYESEVNPETIGIEIYDKMQNIDGTISAIVKLLTLPISSAHPFIKPDKKDNGEAEFVEDILFSPSYLGGMSTPFQYVLADMSRAIVDGFRAFEKVPQIIEEGKWKGKIGWKKIAPRAASTITIKADERGGFNGFHQEANYGGKRYSVDIDPKWSVLFTFQREKNALYGESVLKPAFYHFKIKHKLYYIANKKAEYDATPLRILRLKRKLNSEEKTAAEAAVDSLGINSRITIPEEDIDVELNRGSSSYDPLTLIQHHDKQMTKSALCQFINLSENKGQGSYAMSRDQSDWLVMLLQSILNSISTTFNSFIIAPLIDWNFPNKAYPKLNFEPLADKTKEMLGEIAQKIMTRGDVIIPEEFQKEIFNRTAEQIGLEYETKNNKEEEPKEEEEKEEPKEEPKEMESNVTEEEKEKKRIEEEKKAEEKTKAQKEKQRNEIKKQRKRLKDEYTKGVDILQGKLNEIFTKLKETKDSAERKKLKTKSKELRRKKEKRLSQFEEEILKTKNDFDEYIEGRLSNLKNEVKHALILEEPKKEGGFRRKLNRYESAINLEEVETALDKDESALDKKLRILIDRQKSQLASDIFKIISKNDIKKVNDLQLRYMTAFKIIIRKSFLESFEFGKKNAANEQGDKSIKTPDKFKDLIEEKAEIIAKTYEDKILSKVKLQVLEVIQSKIIKLEDWEETEEIIDNVKEFEDQSRKSLVGMVPVVGLGMGRNFFLGSIKDDTYAYIYSAILDRKVCYYCASLDQRVVKADSSEFNLYAPPQHYSCRCLWVAIRADEKDLPPITGIPESRILPQSFENFKNLKAPVLLKNAPYKIEVEKEINRRKRKVDEYIESGLYENRIKQHEKQIARLESSIGHKKTEKLLTQLESKLAELTLDDV